MNAPHTIASASQIAGVIVPRADRETDTAVIVDHHGSNRVTDDIVLSRVFRTLGWDMLSEEALAMLAREYEAEAAFRERLAAENRALSFKRTP